MLSRFQFLCYSAPFNPLVPDFLLVALLPPSSLVSSLLGDMLGLSFNLDLDTREIHKRGLASCFPCVNTGQRERYVIGTCSALERERERDAMKPWPPAFPTQMRDFLTHFDQVALKFWRKASLITISHGGSWKWASSDRWQGSGPRDRQAIWAVKKKKPRPKTPNQDKNPTSHPSWHLRGSHMSKSWVHGTIAYPTVFECVVQNDS